MATRIFAAQSAGIVTALQGDPAILGPMTSLEGIDNSGGATPLLAIISRVTYDQAAKYQLSESIGDASFLYVFGDKPEVMTVSGIVFYTDCNAGQANASNRQGIDNLLAYYESNKVSKRIAPMDLIIGTTKVIRAFLLTLSTVSDDPENMTWSFSMQLLGPSGAFASGANVNVPQTTPNTPSTTPIASNSYSVGKPDFSAVDTGGYPTTSSEQLLADYGAASGGPAVSVNAFTLVG